MDAARHGGPGSRSTSLSKRETVATKRTGAAPTSKLRLGTRSDTDKAPVSSALSRTLGVRRSVSRDELRADARVRRGSSSGGLSAPRPGRYCRAEALLNFLRRNGGDEENSNPRRERRVLCS